MIPIPNSEGDATAMAAVMCGQGRGFYSAKEEVTKGKNKKARSRNARRQREKQEEMIKYGEGE